MLHLLFKDLHHMLLSKDVLRKGEGGTNSDPVLIAAKVLRVTCVHFPIRLLFFGNMFFFFKKKL